MSAPPKMGESGWSYTPPEILSQIFETTLPTTLEASLAIPSLSPLLLTHVCSRWRKVTHGASMLWVKCNLRCNLNADCTWMENKLLAQAQLWLRNCGNRGVTLGLRFIPHRDGEYSLSAQMEICVHNLFIHITSGNPLASVVRGLNIDWPSGVIASTLSTYIGAPPRLETFVVDFQDGYDTLFRDHGALPISNSQLLRRVHVGRSTPWSDSHPPSLPINALGITPHWPWNQLTHLSLATAVLPEAQAQEFLRFCSNLEEFTLHIRSMPAQEIENTAITLPFLRTLNLYFTTSPTFRTINSVEMPSLRTLTIRSWSLRILGNSEQPSPEFLAQLAELQSLALYPETVFVEQLFADLLGAAPCLSELSVTTPFFEEAQYVFEALTIDPLREETHILPLLRTSSIWCLHNSLYGRPGRREALQKLKAMADSRAQHGPCNVTFVLSDKTYGHEGHPDFESDDSEDEKDDTKKLVGQATVPKKQPYLIIKHCDAESGPADFPRSMAMQRNPGWTASPEAFDR